MDQLKNLSAKELDEIYHQARAELKRRETLKQVVKDITNVLKKHNISFHEAMSAFDSSSSKTKGHKPKSKKPANQKRKTTKAKKNDRRSVVPAKYQHPETNATWSGRGRPPSWVTDVINAQQITIESFKSDNRFLIKTDES